MSEIDKLAALQTQRRGKNGLYAFAFAYTGCQTVVNSRNIAEKAYIRISYPMLITCSIRN